MFIASNATTTLLFVLKCQVNITTYNLSLRTAKAAEGEARLPSRGMLSDLYGDLQVLLGFFEVTGADEAAVPVTVVNPDARARATRRVWNDGESGLKLLTLAPERR